MFISFILINFSFNYVSLVLGENWCWSRNPGTWRVKYSIEMITYSIPCAVCLAISSSCRTSNLLSVTWMWRYKVEPSHHWVTIASSGLAMQPINKRIFTWRVFLKRNTKCKIMRCGTFFPFFVLAFASALVFVRHKTDFSWTTRQQAVSKMTDKGTAYPPRKAWRLMLIYRADKGWAVKRARPSKKVWCRGLGLCLEKSLVFDFGQGLRCDLSIRHCRCHWIMAAWFVFLHFFLVLLRWYAVSERHMLQFLREV